MPVFQMAPCLTATANQGPFFSLFAFTLKFMLFVKYAFFRQPVRISYRLNTIDTMPLCFYLTFLSYSTNISSKAWHSPIFPSSWRSCRCWQRGTCVEIFRHWTTQSLTKVHYLSTTVDKLELLITNRSDTSSISALFIWKSWSSSAIPDGVIDPQDYKLIQADRDT